MHYLRFTIRSISIESRNKRKNTEDIEFTFEDLEIDIEIDISQDACH